MPEHKKNTKSDSFTDDTLVLIPTRFFGPQTQKSIANDLST